MFMNLKSGVGARKHTVQCRGSCSKHNKQILQYSVYNFIAYRPGTQRDLHDEPGVFLKSFLHTFMFCKHFPNFMVTSSFIRNINGTLYVHGRITVHPHVTVLLQTTISASKEDDIKVAISWTALRLQ